jgi:hypothetical protein
MQRLCLCAIVLFTICLVPARRAVAQKPQPDFENEYVTINAPHPSFEVPGFDRKMHIHPFNRVMIYMHPGGEVLHFKDGHIDDLKWQAGEVKWSPAQGPHYSVIPTDTPAFTGPMIVEVAIKKPGDPSKAVSTALDPLKVDPKDCKVEIENDQVRVLRITLGPHAKMPMNEFALNHMTVFITDANLRQTWPEGKSESVQHKAAEYSWSGPSKQSIENLNDGPFEELVVELKN